ncbi:MAG: deoxyhypusine synthase [Pirellulaceae bacterium]|nr:deoxyhypusine synthase [Pirellulaceae bacterium]
MTTWNPSKQELLSQTIEHIDIKRHNVVPLVEAMNSLAYSARDLARAADIFDRMVRDQDCGIILCLAGSLVSAGLKQVFIDLVRNRMVDAVVSTGANIVDQDFFEALGFRHYIAAEQLKSGMYDSMLRDHQIDRIYDTLIDEDELRICDETVKRIADGLPPRPYSSREFIHEMGRYLEDGAAKTDSLVQAAYQMGVPIFCPAFSDCSAGLGMVSHYHERRGQAKTSFDSAKDFYEITQIKMSNPVTGLFMVGGGVPKNFAQDIVVAADILLAQEPGEHKYPEMHKYAIQVTVADVRDGALSSSTLKEASSWGKVDTTYEQMVYSEASIAVPLIAGYAYHKRGWEQRKAKRFAELYAEEAVAVS